MVLDRRECGEHDSDNLELQHLWGWISGVVAEL